VLGRSDLQFVVPALVVTEASYLVGRRLGAEVEARFLRGLCEIDVEAPEPEDWARIAELVEQYADFPLGGTDASVVTLAERLDAEIVVRGPNVMKGYWNRPDATAEVLVNGWFHTGDIGIRDADGYFFIVDRKKDMIISGGENVYPAEVEEVLYQHPGIKEVAVIGVQHPRWGETVRAVVVRKEGVPLTEQEVIDFSQDKLARYKQPKSVVFVDVLPRNPAGKVLKFDLREKHGQPMVDADAPPAPQRATTGAG